MAAMYFSEGTESPPSALRKEKQLLCNIVDGRAAATPEATYAEIPPSPDSYEHGYCRITYRDLASAINGVAWSLKAIIGEGRNHETLAYVGPNDVSYVAMILGAVKVGYKVSVTRFAHLMELLTQYALQLLLLSPRNTASDHKSILDATGCRALLTPLAPHSQIVKGILEARDIHLLHIGSLSQLFLKDHPHYPYPKTFEEAKNEPLVVVHTSGTTAVPKPIVYSHDFAASLIQWSQLEPPAGFVTVSLCPVDRIFITLPFFHVSKPNVPNPFRV